MAQPIKFGTDGWRAIIADDYTVENVKRIATGTALWLVSKGATKVAIGHDTRFGGKLFAETTARVMGAHGLKVNLAKNFVSTPMVSLAVVLSKSDLGIVITASHNPPTYNGFKLKSSFGGPSIPSDVDEVEALIPSENITTVLPSLDEMLNAGLLNYMDMEAAYENHARASFDIPSIQNVGLAFDAMYGAGQRIVPKLLPNAVLLHCENNPSFYGQAPEPIMRNLTEMSALIASRDDIKVGLANDGDADRIGMFDGSGNFVDSHHILLLLLHYQYKYKGLTGKVVVTFSVTDKMRKLAELYNLPFQVTKIGFKYIAEIMMHEDVLVGGEESGGLAVKGHIPERDGAWIGLMIMEFMAKTGKTLEELIQEVYDLVGSFATDRDDHHLQESKKQSIIAACKARTYTNFGDYTVKSVEDIDGYKFYLSDSEWLMIRPSGTEPVLRVYAQAANAADARKILDAAKLALLA
jgi:phosphomannomutase